MRKANSCALPKCALFCEVFGMCGIIVFRGLERDPNDVLFFVGFYVSIGCVRF